MRSSMEMISKKYELTPVGVQEVRYFTEPALGQAVNNALKGLEGASVNSAILQLEKNQAGWNAAVAARLQRALVYRPGLSLRADWGHAVGTTVKFAW